MASSRLVPSFDYLVSAGEDRWRDSEGRLPREFIEAEWASVLGQTRFDEFMNTLRQLWSIRQPDVQGASRPGVVRRGDRSDRSLRQRGRKPSRNR